MHAPFWWFSLVAGVLAVFVQCASARPQSEGLATTQEARIPEARQVRKPQNERRKEVPVKRESHKALVMRMKIERGLRLPMRAKRALLLFVIIRRMRLPLHVNDVPCATS